MNTKKSPKKEPKKAPKQASLYGDEDKVFNVLESDVTTLKADIKAKYDKIDRLKAEIKSRTAWLEEVQEARDIVAKTRKTVEPGKEKTPAEMRT